MTRHAPGLSAVVGVSEGRKGASVHAGTRRQKATRRRQAQAGRTGSTGEADGREREETKPAGGNFHSKVAGHVPLTQPRVRRRCALLLRLRCVSAAGNFYSVYSRELLQPARSFLYWMARVRACSSLVCCRRSPSPLLVLVLLFRVSLWPRRPSLPTPAIPQIFIQLIPHVGLLINFAKDVPLCKAWGYLGYRPENKF